MAIVFGHYGSAAVSEEDPAIKRAESLARGEAVHAITAAELDAMSEHNHYEGEDGITMTQTIWPKSLLGRLIELKPGAYTEAQVKEIENGSIIQLKDGDYGKKWRVWIGWPTDEQKAATPWEGAEGNAG